VFERIGTEWRVTAAQSTREISLLVMREPSGKELLLAPVGPALFELTGLSPANGVVRVAFTRDDTGRVTSMSQIISVQ
jgi:hypothetical protein